jgi:hypothetical protein
MGTITQDAAFFLAGSGWYPVILDDTSETFRVSVTAPKGVYAVMEGRLETHADKADRSLSIWSVARPSGPLAMFAGRYVVNERMHDKVRIATYFFPANAGLSTRYLDAVQRHIGRYEALHGPYPFAKFAVVENFFPTGYGFPSFTLLGSRVLRLPFIPDTSLRHEVAHCWWGNGVFVDADRGQLVRGADHLRGRLSIQGGAFRRGGPGLSPAHARKVRAQVPCNWPWIDPGLFPRQAVRR